MECENDGSNKEFNKANDNISVFWCSRPYIKVCLVDFIMIKRIKTASSGYLVH
jgi:hypothetical protein